MENIFTNWKLFPVKNPTKSFLGNGKVTVAGTVEISFTVMNGPRGPFAALPSKAAVKDGQPVIGKNGKQTYYHDVWFPDETTRNQFQAEAIEAFNASISEVAVAKPKKQSNIPF